MSTFTIQHTAASILLILGVGLILATLWFLGPAVLFLGLIALVGSLFGGHLHFDPRVSWAVWVIVAVGLWYFVRYSRKLGASRFAWLGLALIAASLLAFAFSDPRIEPLTRSESCFGIFGEPRCLVPVGLAASGGRVYRIRSAYQVPRGVRLYAPDGSVLRLATAADLRWVNLALGRAYSLQTGDCFTPEGVSRYLYREVPWRGGVGYVVYRSNGELTGLASTPYDPEGKPLKLLTLDVAARIGTWEAQNPGAGALLAGQ